MLHHCGTKTETKETRGKLHMIVQRRRYCPQCKVRFTTYEFRLDALCEFHNIIRKGLSDMIKQADDFLLGVNEKIK